MPTILTPHIHVLLWSFGLRPQDLRLIPRTVMAKRERKRAHLHDTKGHDTLDKTRREWRFRLRNNASKRAQRWLTK